MAEIKETGKAGLRAHVARTEDARTLPKADAATDVTGDVAIGKDEFRFKKILWSPEDQARFKLGQAEAQIDRNLEALDKAIAQRSGGSPWMKHFGNPELQELRRARSELLKAKKDIAAAKQALDGRFPIWKLAQAYVEPGIWRKPQPDLAEAEARLNSALGRLAHAEHCVQDAVARGPADISYLKADGKGGPAAQSAEADEAAGRVMKCPPGHHPGHPGVQTNRDLKLLLHDIRQTRQGVESAREDVWEAQEKQRPTQPTWPPIHVDPPIWREPPIHKFPPAQGEPPAIVPLPGKLPPLDGIITPEEPVYVKGDKTEDGLI